MKKEKNKIKIAETFNSIQGEGRYAGRPMSFVRVSGCTRTCEWCDTKYHVEGEMKDEDWLKDWVLKKSLGIVCFTGGEPLLYKDAILGVRSSVGNKIGYGKHRFHLETNGDLVDCDINCWDYICFSPKDMEAVEKIYSYRGNRMWGVEEISDVKIVTDLDKVGVRLIPYATMLMPLTTGSSQKDSDIRRKVWEYCVKNDIFYSPRLHVDVWGREKRGV